jgi:hypothetical protein
MCKLDNRKSKSPNLYLHVYRIMIVFLNGKYIINKNQVSAQDEQRSVKEILQNKCVVYKRNTNGKY